MTTGTRGQGIGVVVKAAGEEGIPLFRGSITEGFLAGIMEEYCFMFSPIEGIVCERRQEGEGDV